METARKNAGVVMPVDDPWVSVPRAARLLGISNPTVRTLALHGRLRVQTVGGRTFVHRASIDDYLAKQADASDDE